MKYKRFRTLLLTVAVSLPTHNIIASDWFSMANLQNIGTNIFAIPGSIGQFLQIDKLMHSIAPSLWNSYEAREQQTITGVVTTLVGVIIAILLHASKPQSPVSTPIEDSGKRNIINQIIELASTIEKKIEDYSKKLDQRSILTSQELDQLDQTIKDMQNNLNNIIKPFKILGIDEIQDIKTTETLIDSLKNLHTKLYDLRLDLLDSEGFDSSESILVDLIIPQKNSDIPELDLQWLKRITSRGSTATIADHIKNALSTFFKRLDKFKTHIIDTTIDIMLISNDKLKTLESYYPLRKAQYKQFKQTFNQFIQNINVDKFSDSISLIRLINEKLKNIYIDLDTINAIYDFKQLSKDIDSFNNDLWKIVEQMPTMQKNSLDNVIRFLPQFQEKYNKFKQKLDALKNNQYIIDIDKSLSHNQDAIDVFNESIDSMQKALNSIDLGLKEINELYQIRTK